VLCCVVLCCVVLYCIVLCCVVLHCVVLCCVVLCCVELCPIVSYRTLLSCLISFDVEWYLITATVKVVDCLYTHAHHA
jgi:hypothetical protein